MFKALVCPRPTKQRNQKQPQLRQRSKRKKREKRELSKRKDTTDEKQVCDDEGETVAAGVSYMSGELQLFRQRNITPDVASSTCTMLCLLSIPPELSFCAISQFIGLPLPSSGVSDVLLSALRIENPCTHQVSLVLVFSSSKAAHDCFLRCNGRAFDSLRRQCHSPSCSSCVSVLSCAELQKLAMSYTSPLSVCFLPALEPAQSPRRRCVCRRVQCVSNALTRRRAA